MGRERGLLDGRRKGWSQGKRNARLFRRELSFFKLMEKEWGRGVWSGVGIAAGAAKMAVQSH